MKRTKLFCITLLCFIAYPAMAQTFTVRAFDTAKVKQYNSKWRKLEATDVLKIHLQSADSIEVSGGTLTICKIGKNSNLKIAYPGIWSVKDIWNNQALPSEPNTSGPGDSEKAESVLSIDFYTSEGKTGNVFHEGNSLSGIVLSNLGNEDYYFDIVCVDNEKIESPLYQLPFVNDNKMSKNRSVTVLPFKRAVVVDNQKNSTTVIILYSKHAMTLPTFSRTITLKDIYSRLDAMNIRYAVRIITYSNE